MVMWGNTVFVGKYFKQTSLDREACGKMFSILMWFTQVNEWTTYIYFEILVILGYFNI